MPLRRPIGFAVVAPALGALAYVVSYALPGRRPSGWLPALLPAAASIVLGGPLVRHRHHTALAAA